MSERTAATGTAGHIQNWLVHQVADRLHLPPSRIDPNRPLVDLGLSSIDAVSLSGDLEKRLGVPVSRTLFWEHPTIEEVSRYLAPTRGTDRPEPGHHTTNPLDRLLRNVEAATPSTKDTCAG